MTQKCDILKGLPKPGAKPASSSSARSTTSYATSTPTTTSTATSKAPPATPSTRPTSSPTLRPRQKGRARLPPRAAALSWLERCRLHLVRLFQPGARRPAGQPHAALIPQSHGGRVSGHDYELTKSVSLRQLNPYSPLTLRESGACACACAFDIPEVVLDMDFPGDYFRRIKTVSLTVHRQRGADYALHGVRGRRSAAPRRGRERRVCMRSAPSRHASCFHSVRPRASSTGSQGCRLAGAMGHPCRVRRRVGEAVGPACWVWG
ncbi:putative toxin subunit [Ilyonectria robusta]